MVELKELDLLIKNQFERFCDLATSRYKLGDKVFYPSEIKFEDRHTLNPWLISEDDIKLKFGGFLENEFIKSDKNFSVSAEIKVYNRNNLRADLTIHEILKNEVWKSHTDIMDSLRAVIEIKYASVRTPYYEFKRGLIKKDIQKLGTLSSEILKYLLVVDEGCRIIFENAENEITEARNLGITILSNNLNIAT